MEKRYSYEFAMEEYRKLEEYLKRNSYRCEPSGSLRRKRGDVGDIDFVVEGREDDILSVVEEYPEVEERINRYEFLLKSGITIHTIPEIEEMYNYTLWQSTGPKKHVEWIKGLYREKNIKLRRSNIDEVEVYRGAGVKYILPEERYLYLEGKDDKKRKD